MVCDIYDMVCVLCVVLFCVVSVLRLLGIDVAVVVLCGVAFLVILVCVLLCCCVL